MAKQTKVITKRKKFQEIEIPLTNSKVELIGNVLEDVKDKRIKLDLTRQLKGKSMEVVVKVDIENDKAIANPIKMKLMPYFIRRMIRKRISYVEDSFETPSQESMIRVKFFLITRKKVSRVVRKTLRNKAKNWLEDYISQKNDGEIFNEILSNRLQKPLSLVLKKTYPLSLCEIRVLEIKRPLESGEVPKKVKKEVEKVEESEGFIDQLKEIEEEKIKEAEKEVKKTQKKATEKEKEIEKEKKEEVKELKKEIKKKGDADNSEKDKKEKAKASEKSSPKSVGDTKKEKKTKGKDEEKGEEKK